MSSPRKAFLPVAVITAFLILALPGAAHGEVGVVAMGDLPEGLTVGPYVFSITDDSDPIMGIWFTFSPAGTGRIVLNPLGDTNGDGPPSILRSSESGLPIVAWARNSVSGYDVVVSHFENGAWTEPDVVAGSLADELDPHLVETPGGGIHLFYWVDDGAESRVLHQEAPADLSSWSPSLPVSQTGELASRAKGVFHEDALRVAYEVDLGEGVPKDVVLARREGAGFVIDVLATSYNAGSLWPEPHSRSGRFWVDWVDATFGDESHGEMAWLRQNLQGGWGVSRYEPFDGEEERDFHVRGEILRQAMILP